MSALSNFEKYLKIISHPDKMIPLTKLEFLNPNDTVAYAVDGTYKRRYGYPDSRAFLQEGNINISLNNGQRRTASVRFENLDGAFDYAVNKLWFGRRVRLSKGVLLDDGEEFYLPQGVFYFNSPKTDWKPNSRTVEYQLVDKWAYLDGTLFGNLENTYEVAVTRKDDGTYTRPNIFNAMQKILDLSVFTHKDTSFYREKIDGMIPIFTDYYNNKIATISEYKDRQGNVIPEQKFPMSGLPHTVATSLGGTYGQVLLNLNQLIAGWIGYDATGALRIEASADDINDIDKPILWDFSEYSSTFFGLEETANPSNVYNDIMIWGESLESNKIVGARATNRDPSSDTNANIIGLKTFVESSDSNYTDEQCQALANYYMKRKTVLQKSVTLSCSQMFHLRENNLISVLRSDKPNKPIENHLIQSISLPLNTTSPMSITATSVSDYPDVTEESMNEFLNNKEE